jgi:hypothetical protein
MKRMGGKKGGATAMGDVFYNGAAGLGEGPGAA